MTDERSERTLKRLAVTVMILCIVPWMETLLYQGLGKFSYLISVVLTPLLVISGYGLQALYGKTIRYRRDTGRGSYETTEKLFRPEKALLPIAVSVVIGVAVLFLTRTGMRLWAESTKGVLYDKNSLIPWLVMLLTVGITVFGSALWFYPYHRIVSSNGVLGMGVSFFLNFLIGGMFGVPAFFLAVCFALWLICTVIVMNQGYLSAAADRTTSGTTGRGMRRFNVGMVAVCFILLAAAFVLVLTALGGLTTLGRMLLYFIALRVGGRKSLDPTDSKSNAQLFSDRVFGRTDFTMVSSRTMGVLFGLFVAAVIGAAVFFIFFRAKNRENRFSLSEFLKRLWAELIDFLRNAIHYMKNAPLNDEEDDPTVDYVDTSVRMDPDALNGAKKKKALSWRAEYDRETDQKKRVRVLYRATLGMWKAFGVRIRPSDTPEEIRKKASSLTESQVNALTRLFILCRYAEEEPDPESAALIREAEEALDRFESHGGPQGTLT